MNLPKYASAPLCMLLLALAASSFAADNPADKPAPAAVPAAEQADYAEKMAEAAKAEAEAKAAAVEKAKKEAEAKGYVIDSKGRVIEVLPVHRSDADKAKEADYGIANGRGQGLLFRRGEVIGKYKEEEIVAALLREIRRDRKEKQ